jgi:uncharacterized protein YjbJ (UPF0337 family)
MMKKLMIVANWNMITGKVKQKYANLTNDDILLKEGKEIELLGILQKITGENKEQIRNLLVKI